MAKKILVKKNVISPEDKKGYLVFVDGEGDCYKVPMKNKKPIKTTKTKTNKK